MTLEKRGIPALILTCAFAMFAVAAIPTDAKAATYYNGHQYSSYPYVYSYPVVYRTKPVVYTYTYYTFLQNPRRVQRVQRLSRNEFARDWILAKYEWNAQQRQYGF